jgi:RimJ/RimL family protein N-acetyltransferase
MEQASSTPLETAMLVVALGLSGAVNPTFEKLGARARRDILAHLRQLTPADRALRFGAVMSDESLACYVADIDFRRDSLIGIRYAGGALAGIAQIIPIDSDCGRAAEVAFSVAPCGRGKGLGKRLVHMAIAVSWARGMTRLIARVCPRNTPMLAILRGVGMSLVRDDCDMIGTLALVPLSAQ